MTIVMSIRHLCQTSMATGYETNCYQPTFATLLSSILSRNLQSINMGNYHHKLRFRPWYPYVECILPFLSHLRTVSISNSFRLGVLKSFMPFLKLKSVIKFTGRNADATYSLPDLEENVLETSTVSIKYSYLAIFRMLQSLKCFEYKHDTSRYEFLYSTTLDLCTIHEALDH